MKTQIDRIQTLSDEILISAKMNFIIWPILGTHIHCEPEGYEERLTYQSNIDWLINWLNARFEWLDSAINAL